MVAVPKLITGQKFNFLTAVELVRKLKNYSIWLFLCDCGNKTEKVLGNVLAGRTKSCGCFQSKTAIERFTTHGKTRHPIYKVWKMMIQRCNNPKSSNFKNYGGRGISVCEKWKDVNNFISDMGERPPGTSLDRIDGEKGYYKENCRWATKYQQSCNRSANLEQMYSEYKGVTFDKSRKKWVSNISFNNKNIGLGRFTSEKSAALAYDKKAKELQGIYARLNFPDENSL